MQWYDFFFVLADRFLLGARAPCHYYCTTTLGFVASTDAFLTRKNLGSWKSPRASIHAVEAPSLAQILNRERIAPVSKES